MPQVADLFAKLGLKTDKKAFKQGNRMLGAIKTAVIGLVAFKTVKFFGGLIDDTRREADELAKMSKKLGIGVEALQQLDFAAQISGTNLNTLRTGLQRFARTASDSQRGLKTAKDALKSVNLDVRDGQGGLKDLDVLLIEVSDTFKDMPDGTKKTAIAMELFGRSGAELIPFLNEGSEGIGKLREEFVELGAQISGPMAKQFEQLNDDELRVRTALKGIRNEVVIALLPTLKTMVKSLLSWVKANRALIKQKLQIIMKQLVSILKFLAKAVGFVIENWKLLLGLMVGAKALIGIAKLIVLFKVLGTVGFASGLKAAAGWLAATLPLILLGALVLGATLLVLDLMGVFGDDGPISRFREAAIDAFVGVIEKAVELGGKIREAFKGVVDFLEDKFILKVKTTETARAIRRELTRQRLGGEEGRQARIRALGLPSVGELERETQIRDLQQLNSLDATINITVPEGTEAGPIATKVRDAIGEFWDDKMREAKAATEQ